MEYQYPIDYTWSTEEIVDVIHLFECIEQAYDKGIERDALLASYRRFKEIVPGKAEEKTIFKEFEEVSGYNSYQAVKEIKQKNSGEKIKVIPKRKKY